MTAQYRPELGGAIVRTAVALTILAGGYFAAAWFLGGHVPSNATVGGVQVGGQTPSEAKQTLRSVLADKGSAPVSLRAGATALTLDPARAGLALDLDRSLQGLSGFDAKPTGLWHHLTGNVSVPLRTAVDHDRLRAAVAALAPKVNVPVKEGSISVAGGRVTIVASVTGRRLDVDRTAGAVAQAWPAAGPIPASMQALPPKISNEELQRVNKSFAAMAMSGPVKIEAGKETVSVLAASLAPAISIKAEGSAKLAPVFDKTKIIATVHAAAIARGIEKPAKDATVSFRSGQPSVIPSATGTRIADASIPDAVIAALTSPTRTATVKVATVQPKVTTAAATKKLPKGLISTFTTSFPDNPPRTSNIRTAVATLDGTYVGPGKQFSLNSVLGQRTPEKGYVKAPVIMGDRLVSDYGGGVSQVSTTTFNAAFFAGVRFDAYTPHSFFISRYPEGREATVSWPDVDQRWTNTTDGGILIRAQVFGNAVTVSFYGTKTWDIKASKGPRRNVTQPRTVRDGSAGCVPQSPAPGFDVTVERIFTKGGTAVRTEPFRTHYIPEDEVVCTNRGAG